MAYFDEDGNEVTDVITKAELDAKLAETTTALQKEHETALAATTAKISELETAKNAAAAAVAAAEDGGDKEVNLGNLRKKLEETTSALQAEQKKNEERYTMTQNERIDQQIKSVAGNDAELAKKIRYNYDTMLSGVQAQTAEQIAQKIASAAKLSMDVDLTPNPLDIARMGGSRGAAPAPHVGNAKPFTAAEVAIGSKLGINDADRKKYANDPRLNHK